MVFFSCDQCNESLKKNQVQKHLYRCRTFSLSCIDCNQRFSRTSYAEHIKCVTEDQRYGGKNYVAKEAKGEKKQLEWVELVGLAIEEVSDPRVKGILERVQGCDNIPRKETKFINFLQNSFRIKDRTLCVRAWEGIKREVTKQEELRKKEKEDKEKEQNGEKGGHKEENGETEERQEANGDAKETPQSEFKWKKTIKRKLIDAGGQMKVKKLRSLVLEEYSGCGGSVEDGREVFPLKLEKAGVIIDGKLASLAA